MANIRTFDLNLLRALDALLDTRSVSHAGARLGLSQPAMSGTLARLREALDDPLFVRTQRGIIPTPRALELGPAVKEVLAGIEAMLHPAAFDPARAERTVSLAATDYAQQAVVLPLLAILRREAPGLRLSVRPVEAGFAAQMADGALDLALVTPEMAPDTLLARRLFDESYVCAMRTGHPATEGALDLDRFCAFDHAIMSHDGTRFRGATDAALEAAGRTRRVVAAVPSFLILLEMLRRSDLLALLPARLVEGAEGLTLRPPPVAVPGFTKIMASHERVQHDPAHRWLRGRVVQAVGDGS